MIPLVRAHLVRALSRLTSPFLEIALSKELVRTQLRREFTGPPVLSICLTGALPVLPGASNTRISETRTIYAQRLPRLD